MSLYMLGTYMCTYLMKNQPVEVAQHFAQCRVDAVAYDPIRLATRESKKYHLDKLIAGHAVSLKAILVTSNTSDFAKYPGLMIDNWLTPQIRESDMSGPAVTH